MAITRRTTALAVLCAMSLMIVLDGTIVAVAVPNIQRDLHFSPAGAAWVVNAYLIAFAGLLLLAGRLGDLIGSWRVFLAGLALFTAASLLCGFARSADLLLAGRFLQGAGGALASAVLLGMIFRLFPEPAAQAKALGLFSFTQAAGSVIGFVVGGVLTDLAGWPAIFLINVPIGIVVWLAGRRVLPREAGAGLSQGLDIPGALLITAGLSLGVYAIVRSALLPAIAAVLLIAGFLVRQRTARRPLIPLRLLARPWLLAANAVVVLVFAAGIGFQFLNALFLQRIMGYDALTTGLAFLPAPAVIGPMSLFAAPRLTARFGPRRVMIAGLAVEFAGLLLLARMPVAPSYALDVLPALIVIGAGFGVAIPAVIMTAMAGASAEDSGMVSGFNNTAQQSGAALGLSVLAVIAATHTTTRSRSGASSLVALHDGYTLAFLTAAAFVLTALLLTTLLLRKPPTTPPSPNPPASPSTGSPSTASSSAAASSVALSCAGAPADLSPSAVGDALLEAEPQTPVAQEAACPRA